MRKIIISLSALLTLYACENSTSSSKKESSDQIKKVGDTKITEPNNVEKTLSIAAFKIVDKNNKVGLQMDSTGKCFVESKALGTFEATGIFKSIDGKILAKFMGDNFVDANGNNMVTIDSIGNFTTKEGAKMSWADDGNILKNKESSGMKLVPCNNKTKQVASAIFYLYFAMSSTSVSEIKASN